MSETIVDIHSSTFLINGEPTLKGKTFRGQSIEGLLLNSRMVQATFDDLNPETRPLWDYSDGPWDAERNLREFLNNLPGYQAHGLDAVTVNFQGGSPYGYSADQPWHNSAFDADGTLRADYADRMKRLLDTTDLLGMVVILGLFYCGQDHRLEDEAAVICAVDNTIDWLIEGAWRHVLLEIANECDITRFTHDIITAPREAELVRRVQQRSEGKIANAANRLLVSTSYRGGAIPSTELAQTADFILIHGNRQDAPVQIRNMVRRTRTVPGYKGQPIVFNEDDHFDFDQPDNNFAAALESGAGWGFFDYRMKDEGSECGFQSVPVDWRINSERKRGFFDMARKIAR